MAWTKADIERMKSTLTTAYLLVRPLDWRDRDAVRVKFLEVIDEHRVQFVLHGLTQNQFIAEGRAIENDKTADHFLNNPQVYGDSTPEMVERFRGFAEKDRRGAALLQRLIQKIIDEGLPAEIVTFDPTRT